MAQQHILKAHTRKRSGSAALNALRKEGLIPAIVYGKAQENVNIRLDRKAVTDVLHRSASQNILVTLEIEDRKENKTALVKSVQTNPLTGAILHIDFQSVKDDEIIKATVPVELLGESPGVKAGGLLEFLTHSLEVVCLPKHLPETIAVDISGVGVGSALHVGELKLPEGVKATTDPKVTVVLVTEIAVVEETPAAAAKDAKGKKPAAKAAAKK
jgi:large subunit ribosomal protein L25